MKQLLFILLVVLTSLNSSYAQQENPLEETTWNVIRERLFSGENPKAYRFEEDIRFQVIGAKTHQDSVVFTQMINQLNGLLGTVQIKMVDQDPNFRVTIEEKEGGFSRYYSQIHSGSEIKKVYIGLSFNGNLTDQQTINCIYFLTVRNLVKLFPPRHGSTHYNGILDAENDFQASELHFNKIDKEILRELYSKNFYKNLKTNIVRSEGFEYYIVMRFEKLLYNLFLALKVLLAIVGFMYFLLRESKKINNPGLFSYLKQRWIILVIFPFFYSFIQPSGNLLILAITRSTIFIVNYFIAFLFGIFFLIFIYYSERLLMKKVHSFIGQQSVVILTTITSAFIVPLVLIPIINMVGMLFDMAAIGLNYFSTFQNATLLFLIFLVVALRFFYNFINYRIQSMVNQKDVEIAKMKELKNQAELNALHSRINPHFLYNSLNSIASLAHIDADKTENMATGLSELFRYSINKEDKTFVTVTEELEMVTKYLEIEKTRFDDKLVYTIDADESTRDKQIPKFLIQPLVENAVKHGLSKIKAMGKITVEVKQLEKDLSISIFDNGPDFPAEPVSGYGLQNLHDKLDIIYGNDAGINWENGDNKHVRIILKNQFK
ncbi:sensor histidine kinase [Maribellus sediminis]|uniref:sensor histidine kinase n=1 Tax=Maribellus sediminis TaxID=2696285 RepID=UPI00142F92A4|nr:histidine kinase [Maribellus sediminis]